MRGVTMKTLVLVCMTAAALPLAGCIMVDCGTVRHIDGRLVDADQRPINGWVGATLDQRNPEETYDAITDRERWGDPDKSWLGLTHTDEDGHFDLRCGSGINWGYTLLFGFIPLGSTRPPDVAVVDHLFLHIHDDRGWRSTRVALTPEQQARAEPGKRWVGLGTVILR
jgi:hypothetical protein